MSTRTSLKAALLVLAPLLLFSACDSGNPTSGPPGDDDPPASFDEDGTWIELAGMPEPTYDASGTAYRDRIYVVGGFTADGSPTAAVHRYDPAADAWSRLADAPKPIAQAGLVAHRDTLFFLGGNAGTEQSPAPRGAVLRYDPEADAWHDHSTLPETRDQHGSASVGGRLVVFGGAALEPPPGDSTAVYDGNGAWRRGTPPPRAHNDLEVWGAVGGELLAVEQRFSAALDVFEPTAEAWTTIGSIPFSEPPRVGTTWKSRLHVLSYNGADRFHRAFDPSSRAWVRLPPLEDHLRDAVAVGLDDRLYVIGGRTRDGTVLGTVRAFTQP